jgi:hypothetical protein
MGKKPRQSRADIRYRVKGKTGKPEINGATFQNHELERENRTLVAYENLVGTGDDP